MSDATQRALMRSIWAKNQERRRNPRDAWFDIGFDRQFEKPWLIENFVERHPTERDIFGNPKILDTRVTFPDGLPGEGPREIPLWEHYQRFRQSIEYLYWRAERVRKQAHHYDDFHVGCAMLGYRPVKNPADQYRMYTGKNFKVRPNARPTCAEPIALAGAEMDGCTWIVGVVVVGKLRKEDIGVIKTLHPCAECRVLMNDIEIVTPKTLIVTAKPPTEDGTPGEYEIRTFQKLLSLHERLDGHAH